MIFGKRDSVENPKHMRRFYNVYSHDKIWEDVFTLFENLTAVSIGGKFYLSCCINRYNDWGDYVSRI